MKFRFTVKRIPLVLCFLIIKFVIGVEILSKSKLERCEKVSDSDELNCSTKIVVNMAVPSGASGGEASIVAEIVEVEENATQKMHTVRIPPVVTVNKSAAYAMYEITYIRDVPYKPVEYYVKTRKCEPDADARVVQICERLRDENGHIIEHSQPICCPCGPQHRVPSSCGNVFDKLVKGKANTAHCLRFPGDWFHVFGIGKRSLGFNIQIEVKIGSKTSEVIVGPEKRTVLSNDNFLRVNLIGDFVGYTSIPSFEDFYLVIPRQDGPGPPQNLGGNFSMWMLLERVRFTLDGLECNKIGVSYEAYNGQPNFCSSPFWSCLHNQLWNYREADKNRISRNQVPLFGVEGRFERINQHPNAGTHSFSIGITEALNSNLLVELRADDIEYVYQRSPGKILGVTIPTFEALTQFGTATVTTKNIGKLEASYSLTSKEVNCLTLGKSKNLIRAYNSSPLVPHEKILCELQVQGPWDLGLHIQGSINFNCSSGVTLMEEQFYIMKPDEVAVRSFKLYPTTDQAAKYVCAAILKDSDFNEVDRAECQFTTTATVLDNGSQISPFQPPKAGINGFFESVEVMWNRFWDGVVDFFSGRNCRRKCSGFFDFSCHIQYICMSWVMMFGLFLAIFPTVIVLLWLLHQKGFFDPIYEWWDDQVEEKQRAGVHMKSGTRLGTHNHLHRHHKKEGRHHSVQNKRSSNVRHELHKHRHGDFGTDHHQLHYAHMDRHKVDRGNNSGVMYPGYSNRRGGGHYIRGKGVGSMDEKLDHHRLKERKGKL